MLAGVSFMVMILLGFFGAARTFQGRSTWQFSNFDCLMNSRPDSSVSRMKKIVNFSFLAKFISIVVSVFYYLPASYFSTSFAMFVSFYSVRRFRRMNISSSVFSVAKLAIRLMAVFVTTIFIKTRQRFNLFAKTAFFSHIKSISDYLERFNYKGEIKWQRK